jgi:hypothetical protein
LATGVEVGAVRFDAMDILRTGDRATVDIFRSVVDELIDRINQARK